MAKQWFTAVMIALTFQVLYYLESIVKRDVMCRYCGLFHLCQRCSIYTINGRVTMGYYVTGSYVIGCSASLYPSPREPPGVRVGIVSSFRSKLFRVIVDQDTTSSAFGCIFDLTEIGGRLSVNGKCKGEKGGGFTCNQYSCIF